MAEIKCTIKKEGGFSPAQSQVVWDAVDSFAQENFTQGGDAITAYNIKTLTDGSLQLSLNKLRYTTTTDELKNHLYKTAFENDFNFEFKEKEKELV